MLLISVISQNGLPNHKITQFLLSKAQLKSFMQSHFNGQIFRYFVGRYIAANAFDCCQFSKMFLREIIIQFFSLTAQSTAYFRYIVSSRTFLSRSCFIFKCYRPQFVSISFDIGSSENIKWWVSQDNHSVIFI